MARREILVADLRRAVRIDAGSLERLALRVLRREKMRAGGLSIAFVNRAKMRRINRTFLRHDFDTDVLAFPMEGELVGEIVISTDFARKQARERRIPVHEEIARYLVHGILHLAGYDDHAPKSKAAMWKRQESYLK